MSKAEELAQQYADASATWHVENLYGGSKSYTEECRKDKAAIGVDLFSELRRLAAENEALRKQIESQKDEWLSWAAKRKGLEKDAARYRFLCDFRGQRTELCFDGESYRGKVEFDAAIDSAMKENQHG